MIGVLAMLRAQHRAEPYANRGTSRGEAGGPDRQGAGRPGWEVAVLTVVLRAWLTGQSPGAAVGRPGLPDPPQPGISHQPAGAV